MSIQIDRRLDSLIKYNCTFLKDFYDKFREFDDKQMETLNNDLKIKNTLVVDKKTFQDFIQDLKLPTKEYYLKIE